ncbi:MAG: RNA polymerase sigma factor [Chloroflexota bacterium]
MGQTMPISTAPTPAALSDPGIPGETAPDVSRFGVLYERYRQPIHAYLRSRTSTDEDADDLTQQVFLRALEALPRYRPRQVAFSAWLFRIARNAAVDFHRRSHAAITWDLVPVGLQPIAQTNLEAAVIHQESLIRLRELFLGLKPESRELLTLRFVGQLTAPEIAAVVGAREAATRKRLTRLLQSLKERYDAPTF